MCQAIVKPFDVTMLRRPLAAAWACNPDGGGFAYYDSAEDKVIIEKGFTSFVTFWKAFREHQHQNVLLHFRWATHGDKCAENTHPFMLRDNQLAMAHNGVLFDYLPIGTDNRSDSRIFAETVLVPAILKMEAIEHFLTTPVLALLEQLVRSNKLVFLSKLGFHIVNEQLGEWEKGIWWSGGYPFKYTYTHVSTGWLPNMDEAMSEGEFEDIPDKGYDAYQDWLQKNSRPTRGIRTYNQIEAEALEMAEDEYDKELEVSNDVSRAELAADVAYDSYMATFAQSWPNDTAQAEHKEVMLLKAAEVIDAEVVTLPPTSGQRSNECYVPAKYRVGTAAPEPVVWYNGQVMTVDEFETRQEQRAKDKSANDELMQRIIDRAGALE